MANKKQLSVNMVANIVSYSINVIISFFLTPYLIRELGKEAYSFYPIALNFVQYMGIITTALNSMASRFITIEIAKRNIQKANVYYSSVFYANIILSAILLPIMAGAIIFLEKILNIPMNLVTSIKVLFILVFLSMIIGIVTSVFGVAVFAKNRIDLRSFSDIVSSVLKLILFLVMFYLFVPNIIYVGAISVFLSLVGFAFHWCYTKKLLPDAKISPKLFETKMVMEIISSGVWNSINQIGSILMFSLSIVFCNVLISAEAGGEYSIIQTIPNFINGIISTLAAVFLPSVTNTYATRPLSEVVDEVKMSQKFMGIITNVPIVVFMVIGTDFYNLWVPGENAQKLHMLSILVVFHLQFIGVTWTVNNLNTVINRVKVPALYLMGSGVVNIALVLLLINVTNLGIFAIPISSALILLVWAGVFIPIYPCIALGLKWNTFYGAIYKMLISSAIIFAFTIILHRFVSLTNWFSLVGFCAVTGIMGVCVNLVLVLNKAERQQLVRVAFKKLR